MSLSTLVVKGTTGPLHRAILRLVPEWTAVEGVPDALAISLGGPGTNSIVVVTDTRLCTFIRNELYRRATDKTHSIWLRQILRQNQDQAVDGIYDLPSSVSAEMV